MMVSASASASTPTPSSSPLHDDFRRSFNAPRARIRYYSRCTAPAAITMHPGDLVLVSGGSWRDRLIQFGERLHLRKGHRIYANINHAATVVSADTMTGAIIVQEMSGGGGRLTNLAAYAAQGKTGTSFAVVTVSNATMSQRNAAQRVAMWYVNVPYGWASIFTDAIYCLTGFPLFLTIGQSVVCSASATAAQRCLGLIPDKPDIAVMPSDLARYYDVQLKVNH